MKKITVLILVLLSFSMLMVQAQDSAPAASLGEDGGDDVQASVCETALADGDGTKGQAPSSPKTVSGSEGETK
ncbi:MAG: hypothetical protein KBD63_06525 [Bacteriovoracaceae bacterium]|nr:hypothetical protein [Bacteriovoracaceae bacterium]